MGGILVKEMLRLACLETAPPHQRQLAAATVGLVFYACPHQGSWLANLGWNLRWLGASPASSVPYLVPGPHLEASCYACCSLHAIACLCVMPPRLHLGAGPWACQTCAPHAPP